MYFKDRTEAGRLLARKFAKCNMEQKVENALFAKNNQNNMIQVTSTQNHLLTTIACPNAAYVEKQKLSVCLK